MPLGFSYAPAGGEYLDIVKYAADAGIVLRRDRLDDGSRVEIEITDDFVAIFDFAGLEQGWAMFDPGAPPRWEVVHHESPYPPRPKGEGWKQGFRMKIALGKSCQAKDGDVREFGGTSDALKQAIAPLFEAWESEGNKDRLPVIKMTGRNRVKNARGKTIFHPVFEIMKWVDRPDYLDATPIGGGSTSSSARPASGAPSTDDGLPETGSRRMAPADNEDDF